MNRPKKHQRQRYLSFIEHSDQGDPGGFIIQKKKQNGDGLRTEELPVPGENHLKYGHDEDRYLATGKQDADTLQSALLEAGIHQKSTGNVLEFGCANARILRWFSEWTRYGEVWGVDIDSELVFWCHENLSPPFYFAVSTTVPHLFFEDHFFGLVFCYSVFTHIDDLFLSWICELRRIIKPGGFLALTINDEASQARKTKKHISKQKHIFGSKIYRQYQDIDADLVAVNRDVHSFITVKRMYFTDLVAHAFDVVSIVEATMGKHQTLLVLKRR